MERSPKWGKRVIAYSFLAILAVAALGLVTTTLRRPQSADVIDTRIESGRHLTFVLMAQQVAPGAQPDPAYVTQVRAARDSLRALAAREGIYYSTVGVGTHWEIAEGLRVLNAYGPFDEVSVGRGWFNTGRFRYSGGTVPAAFGVSRGHHRGTDFLDFGGTHGSCALRRSSERHVSLTANNILNNLHREFVGAPEVGRLLLFRVRYDF